MLISHICILVYFSETSILLVYLFLNLARVGLFYRSQKIIFIKTTKQREFTKFFSQECFSPYGIGIYLPKNSLFKRKFDDAIGKMWQSGLIRKGFSDALKRSKKVK